MGPATMVHNLTDSKKTILTLRWNINLLIGLLNCFLLSQEVQKVFERDNASGRLRREQGHRVEKGASESH